MTLAQTAATVRKVVRIGLTILALYLVFLILTPIVKAGYFALFPPKDLPNALFGLLDPIEFIEQPVSISQDVRYTLNTSNGRLPTDIPNKAIVYKYQALPFSYEAGRNAQETAQKLGFEDDELITDLKGTTYVWRSKESGGLLEINTQTEEITLTTPLIGRTTFFNRGTVNTGSAVNDAKAVFQNLNRLTDPLYETNGRQAVTLGRITASGVAKAESVLDAHLVRVDFYRDINKVPIVGPDPKKGNVSVTLANPANTEAREFNYPEITYHQWEIQPDSTATYPLISVSEAWSAVAQQKKGVVVSVIPVSNSVFSTYVTARVDEILINKVYLAYYDHMKKQNYMQPIYVFEGSYNVSNRPGGDIVLYYPAIPGQYIKPVEQDKAQTN